MYIADAKYGAGKLVKADTMQLLFYACATASQFSSKYKFTKVTGAIFQPRKSDEDGDVWREIDYNQEELYDWIDKIVESAKRSLHIRAVFNAKKVLTEDDALKWLEEEKAPLLS